MTRNRLKKQADLHLERMFETRSQAWEDAGLAVTVSQREIRRAQRQAVVLAPLLIGVLVFYHYRDRLLPGLVNVPAHLVSVHGHLVSQPAHLASQHVLLRELWRWATVIVILAGGWAAARDIGRAAAPTFFKRMDPATAGTVGFLFRLATMAVAVLIALRIAGAHPQTLLAGSAFTAVVFGLAAQQTLGNVIAGTVLLSARPFRVGERVQFKAGAVGGQTEGIVSSLGLLYTTLASGENSIMIPNSVVLAAVVIPLREPESVDVRVHLNAGILPSQVQALLDHEISTPQRSKATVILEEIDGDDVVVRVQATPERASEGARLADEVIGVLARVTSDHEIVSEPSTDGGKSPEPDTAITRKTQESARAGQRLDF
ncbi:MAG: mechanosensitive ion channel family protein [Actinomycetota bacterium]|nr:mechanosensitive ion channel family protein [Actinomycetota bacterium]